MTRKARAQGRRVAMAQLRAQSQGGLRGAGERPLEMAAGQLEGGLALRREVEAEGSVGA